ncbi:unnamed protein product [Lymnaea stagnalis]|uniref:Protein sprint n=1 Tax=Lymnaea stagnalis TaxID=6523 RepID=A0AAV2HGG2_LYMST
MRRRNGNSAYVKMLGNIASDLDSLLTDLCHVAKDKSDKEDPCASGTLHSGDTLGKDSFFSSVGNTSRRQGEAVSSEHSLASLSDNEIVDCDSVDSGHDGRTSCRPSPLVFDPHHFGAQSNQRSSPMTVKVEVSPSMDELRPISTIERLTKTNSIWLLSSMSRAGAVHLLKDRETGNFIVRKSSQPSSLALSVQSKLSGHSVVDHYLIEGSSSGFKLQGSSHFFHSIPALIAYYVENIDEISYHLRLPRAIQQARSTRELASLNMLGQDFWISPISRKSPSPEPMSGMLHKSSSEPINIQRPPRPPTPITGQVTQNTVPSRSATDFSHFMKNQLEMESYFQKHIQEHSPAASIPHSIGPFRNKVSDTNTNLVSSGYQTNDSGVPHASFVTRTVIKLDSSLNSNKENPVSTAASPISSNTLPHFNRLASVESWVLASSPVLPDKQQTSQENDIYRSNPSNQPVSLVSQQHKHSPHTTRSGISSDCDQGSIGEVTRDKAWPVHPKQKSNLYFTTNLGLLEIPENSYFTSNLSDKLSDYEDIWRNSCCESDADRNGANMIHDPRAVLEAKVTSQKKNGAVKDCKKKVLRKTPRDSPPARRAIEADRDSVTGGTTGLTALEQARMIAGSASEDEFSVPAVLETVKPRPEKPVSPTTTTQNTLVGQHPIHAVSPQPIKYLTSHMIQVNTPATTELSQQMPQTNFALIKNLTSQSCQLPSQSCQLPSQSVFTTTMFVTMNDTDSKEISYAHSKIHPSITARKPILSPLGRLSRLKSSSESSLATASSPLYAEPVDAVKLRDKNGKAINIQVRRLSAPLAANQILEKQKKSQYKVSKHPQLDTILSPDAQPVNNPTQNKFIFDTAAIKSQSPGVPSAPVKLSRSFSMRTHQEMSQLQRKQSWKDRLNRLKLGTKVLTRNLTPPTAISMRKPGANQSDQTLDTGLFKDDPTLSNSGQNKTLPGKFPVEQHHDRASCFSESSTVQDLISCAHPELTIRPIVPITRSVNEVQGAALSEYDNLQIYRASTDSSQGTVYSPPWETGTANKLIREPPLNTHVLPPAMDFQERIQRWQQANSSYHGTSLVDNNSVGTDSKTHNTEHPFHQQQLQLLQHQQQLQLLQHQQHIKVGERSGHRQVQNNQLSAPDFQNHRHQGQTAHPDCPFEDNLKQDHVLENQSKHPDSGIKSPVSLGSLNKTLDSLGSFPLSNLTITSANFADVSSSAHTSPQRLSSHCPDVVNCHSSPQPQDSSPSSGVKMSEACGHVMGMDDVLFGRELAYASEDLKNRLRPVLSPQTSMSHNDGKSPGAKIKEYIFKLSGDRKTIFGSTIENFIQCTLEGHETNPQYVMRNVRQFMTGIKNYLVKHGEGELEDLIERERNKLGTNEILNIDAIIEQALHVCVLKPLKYHIYRLFVDKYSNNGALEQLSRNIKYARTKSAQDIGVKPGLNLPQNTDMDVIRHYLDLMQRSYSPFQKLQNLLKATSTIYHCVQGRHHQVPSRGPSSLGADDFLPMLIYVLVHCGLVSAEIEADFMWGLLQPSLLTGEGGYYLTTLSSAVLILKNFQETHQLVPAQMEGHLPTISDMQGFLKIAIPDELHGSITWKTLPVRPNMNTRDVCSMVAHKFKITNPQDFGLYLLCDGQESHLADTDCPQIIKGDNQAVGKSCYFAFKRVDANIAWPKHMKTSSLSKQPG